MIKEVFSSDNEKRGIVSEALPWILIAIAVLVILLLTVFILKGKGVSLIEHIKDLFKI
jgi:hypothetical protein